MEEIQIGEENWENWLIDVETEQDFLELIEEHGATEFHDLETKIREETPHIQILGSLKDFCEKKNFGKHIIAATFLRNFLIKWEK